MMSLWDEKRSVTACVAMPVIASDNSAGMTHCQAIAITMDRINVTFFINNFPGSARIEAPRYVC
jgi:hypothetical protein